MTSPTPFPPVDNDVLLYVLLAAMVLNLSVAAVALLKRSDSRYARKWRRLDKLCALLVSADRRKRTFILQHLVGLANCFAGLLALNYGVSRGEVDPVGCAWLTYSALTTIAVITIMLRTGLNRRFADPSLMTVHIVFAEVFLAWGYYLGGPCRAVGMMLLFVVLLANFFTRTTQIVLRTSLVAVVCFGAAMLLIAWQERALPNGPRIQMVNFCVLLMALASLYLLVCHLTRIRAISAQRKSELIVAMARIQELATRDELTHLFNRRHAQALLVAEKSRCDRTGYSFCVGIIDIDHFKRINDSHGHGVGDQVLVAVAALLTQGMRDLDVIARWGGEEFLVMFPDTHCEMAEQVLGRMLGTLTSAMVCPELPAMRVSFSAGIAQFEPGEALNQAIERADVALYEAKRAGRGRIVRADYGQREGLLACS